MTANPGVVAQSRIRKARLRHGLRNTAIGFAVLGLVLTMDGLLGVFYSTSTEGRVIVTPSQSSVPRQAIVVFPGYVMSGQVLAEAFAPYLRADDAMLTVQYAQRGVDMDRLYQAVMVQLKRLAPSRLRIYGASMGGLCANEFLDRYARDGSPYGEPVLVLDTAPSGTASIKRPGFSFGLASWYRGGPLTSLLWAWGSGLVASPPAEAGANRSLIARGRNAGEWAGMPALTSQAAFMGQLPPRPAFSSKASARVVYLHGSNPQDDPLIRINRAVEDWRNTFPAMTVNVIRGRAGSWHIPLVERPRETMEALLGA